MKRKLHPIFVIIGLFLFKVGVIDNMRNIGHHEHHGEENTRYVASVAPEMSGLKPIR